jgi:hypothetical protein
MEEVCLNADKRGALKRSAAASHRLRSPFAGDDGELPLLEAFEGAILVPK